MLHVISTLVLFALAAGIYFRQRPEIHMKVMTGAFVTDLALVLYIELTRQAVETVVTQVKPFIWFHAAISLTVLVLYVVQLVLGGRLLAARAASLVSGGQITDRNHTAQTRHMHRFLGMTFCAFRLANYVTAFMI